MLFDTFQKRLKLENKGIEKLYGAKTMLEPLIRLTVNRSLASLIKKETESQGQVLVKGLKGERVHRLLCLPLISKWLRRVNTVKTVNSSCHLLCAALCVAAETETIAQPKTVCKQKPVCV